MEASEHGRTEELIGGLFISFQVCLGGMFSKEGVDITVATKTINVQNMRVRDLGKLMDQSQEGKRRRDQNYR